MENKNYLETAKALIITLLNSEITAVNINEAYRVKLGDEKVIKAHIKEIKNIMDKALKEIEKK